MYLERKMPSQTGQMEICLYCKLQAVLRIIYAHEKVIGVDITGECSATLDYLSEVKEASVNNKTNEELMQMILSESVLT